MNVLAQKDIDVSACAVANDSCLAVVPTTPTMLMLLHLHISSVVAAAQSHGDTVPLY